MHVFDPDLLKNTANRLVARTVQRRINYRKIVCDRRRALRRHGQFLYRCNIGVIHLRADDLQQPLRFSLLNVHPFDASIILNRVDMLQHHCRRLRGKLPAILPIDFIAVIFRRIVASRNDDTRNAL